MSMPPSQDLQQAASKTETQAGKRADLGAKGELDAARCCPDPPIASAVGSGARTGPGSWEPVAERCAESTSHVITDVEILG